MPEKSVELFIAIDRGSIANANNKGDKGQPWRVPRVRGKVGDISELDLTLANGFEYSSRIQEMNFGPKPNFCKTRNKYCHSTRSNAFSASSEIINSGS